MIHFVLSTFPTVHCVSGEEMEKEVGENNIMWWRSKRENALRGWIEESEGRVQRWRTMLVTGWGGRGRFWSPDEVFVGVDEDPCGVWVFVVEIMLLNDLLCVLDGMRTDSGVGVFHSEEDLYAGE